MVMLENESNSVGVHPSVPYSEIKAAHLKNICFHFCCNITNIGIILEYFVLLVWHFRWEIPDGSLCQNDFEI